MDVEFDGDPGGRDPPGVVDVLVVVEDVHLTDIQVHKGQRPRNAK
jgi:hypothetical protein